MGRRQEQAEIVPLIPGENDVEIPPELAQANEGAVPIASPSHESEESNASETESERGTQKKERRSRLREAQARVSELEEELAKLRERAQKTGVDDTTLKAARETIKAILESAWDVITYDRGTSTVDATLKSMWSDSVLSVADYYNIWGWLNHPIFPCLFQTGMLAFAVASMPPLNPTDVDAAYAGNPAAGIGRAIHNARLKRAKNVTPIRPKAS